MTLREQIEALADCGFTEPHEAHEYVIAREDKPVVLGCRGFAWRAVLDIIDQHECYDRDALARALPGWMTEYPMEGTEDELALAIASNIITALKEQA